MVQAEFENYLRFMKKNYPNSSFWSLSESNLSQLFFSIHTPLVVSELFTAIKDLNPISSKLLLDQKLIYLKLLYILPNNDDFQYNAIMRANVENLLRLVALPFVPHVKYADIKETSFSELTKVLDQSYFKQKYRDDYADLKSLFGGFSKKLHGLKIEKNSILYLEDIMRTPILQDKIDKKTRAIKFLEHINIVVFLDLYKIKSNYFDTPQLTQLHSVLGEESYINLPIFN